MCTFVGFQFQLKPQFGVDRYFDVSFSPSFQVPVIKAEGRKFQFRHEFKTLYTVYRTGAVFSLGLTKGYCALQAWNVSFLVWSENPFAIPFSNHLAGKASQVSESHF